MKEHIENSKEKILKTILYIKDEKLSFMNDCN